MLSFITWEHVANAAMLCLVLISLCGVFLMWLDGYFSFEQTEKRKAEENEENKQ